jgi:hypothetical protein
MGSPNLSGASASNSVESAATEATNITLFVWLVADGWCWFVLREKYCWLVAGA